MRAILSEVLMKHVLDFKKGFRMFKFIGSLIIILLCSIHALACPQFSNRYKTDTPGAPELEITQNGCRSIEVSYVYPDGTKKIFVPELPNENLNLIARNGWFNDNGYVFVFALRGEPGPNVGTPGNAFAGIYTVVVSLQSIGSTLKYDEGFYGTDDSGMKDIKIQGLGKHLVLY
jgi:hypothetical protein